MLACRVLKKSPLLFLVLATSSALAGEWPQFRGPSGDGHAPDARPPIAWTPEKNTAWKTAIPGKGWSTPVVSATRVWVTTATPDGKQYSVLGLDRSTGAVVFDKVLFTHAKPEPLGNAVNGYASPSPLLAGDRLFVHFGSYGTACLDAVTGAEHWRRTDLPCRHYRGPGSSLTHFRDTLILTMDGVDVQYLTALDMKTGKTVWKTDRTTDFGDLGPDGQPQMEGDYRKAYTTPVFVDRDGPHPWFLSIGAKATFGYDAATGKELWKVTYPGFSNASSAVWSDGIAVINTGYGKANLHAYAIDASTRGTIPKDKLLWDCLKRVPLRGTPVVVAGHVYMIDDGGFASCVVLKTGEVTWSERIEGNFSGSPVFAGGKILIGSEHGEFYALEPTPEKLTIAAETKLPEGMLATPVAVDSELYLRTREHVWRIQ